ncbi:FAD binding domain-containing protein [Arenibacterium sp. LLYu02]|uniref:FAD binding domain-containing protein n=1 Tax=Arenibacterium sp. LLYu02 TaxID=3404132 RepID=UPI003B21B365
MREFEYLRPEDVATAGRQRAEDEEASFLAGGMTLIPSMKNGLAAPSALIDLSGIADLAGIRERGETLEIGAMTRHCDVAASALVTGRIPALAGLAGGIGDPAVRHRGTIGGSLANSDPSADYPAGVLGLNATVITDRRAIPADDFFFDLFETALEDGELIVAIRFPCPLRASYRKVRSQASGYAVVGVMVAELTGGEIRVAVTGAGHTAFRATALETALQERFDPDALDGISLPHDDLLSDIHASAEYRAHRVVVEARRAVASLMNGQTR